MQVEFAEELTPVLEVEGNELQVQAKFVSQKAILDAYLNRGYGNAYNFDQEEQLEGVF